MNIEQIDWIISYLPQQKVTISDLQTFFEIQNNGKVECINKENNIYDFILDNYVFTIWLTNINDSKLNKIVKSVFCTNKN